MTAYYNEIDKNAADWLRELIKGGHIAAGEVDERSITDVAAADLKGFTQHHFFAGIGAWSYALRLAGWPDERPVVTASLPCQPFSCAGQQRGKSDERHLLPHFVELVKQCHFQTIFGEQVPAAIGHGWLDDLCDEMERENYAVGAIVLTAAGVGAAHIRQRLYWCANSNERLCHAVNAGLEGFAGHENRIHEQRRNQAQPAGSIAETVGVNDWLADTAKKQRKSEPYQRRAGVLGAAIQPEEPLTGFGDIGAASGGVADAELSQRRPGNNGGSIIDGQAGKRDESTDSDGERGAFSRLADAENDRRQRGEHSAGQAGRLGAEPVGGAWTDCDWLYCRDGKYRPVEPGLSPLVDGSAERMVRGRDIGEPFDADHTQEARVMRLKGYGNAICAQTAAEFIRAFMEVQA